jgi:hypothetical protein
MPTLVGTILVEVVAGDSFITRDLARQFQGERVNRVTQ